MWLRQPCKEMSSIMLPRAVQQCTHKLLLLLLLLQ
jgi:hypothetical protein